MHPRGSFRQRISYHGFASEISVLQQFPSTSLVGFGVLFNVAVIVAHIPGEWDLVTARIIITICTISIYIPSVLKTRIKI